MAVDNNINETSQTESERPGGTLAWLGEMIKVGLIALVIILPVRYFLIKPFYVQGASMEPNYYNHEYLIINEISYRFNSPARGEVVVFHYPGDKSQYFIKRVIGLPDERIVIRDGQVIIYNQDSPAGWVLREPYLSPGVATAGAVEVMLKADEFFVLGDNREASLDSRRFGPVKRQEIVGRTWLRGWPLPRVGVLKEGPFNF